MPPSSASPIAAEASAATVDAHTLELREAPLRRIRLLLLTDTCIASSGGSERFLRNLVARLPGDRYDITLVQLADGHHVSTHALPVAAHVTVLHMPVGAVYGLRGWRVLATLRRWLHAGRFDIVQSHHEKSDLINALLPRHAGCVHVSNRRDMGHNKSARMTRLARLVNHRFDCVIAPSQPILTRLALCESVDPERMLWIPNGVDTQRFQAMPAVQRRRVRQSLGLDDAHVAFVCVARFSAEKRHVDLIEAFALLHARQPQVRLLLVGAGPLRDDVEAQVSASGLTDMVNLLGGRPDIEALLSAMDVGLLVSCTEGMSNAILEMMACALPVVATAVGGNPALVEADVTGKLVPALQPATLADAMAELADAADDRARLGAAGRARIERDHSLAAMVNAFDHTYRRLAPAP